MAPTNKDDWDWDKIQEESNGPDFEEEYDSIDWDEDALDEEELEEDYWDEEDPDEDY